MQEIKTGTSKKRPRNFFLPERNEKLIYRYYFHAEINRLRYDDCLAQLEIEFDLTSIRIVNVLTEHTTELNDLVHERPDIKTLEKKFPWLNWTPRSIVRRA